MDFRVPDTTWTCETRNAFVVQFLEKFIQSLVFCVFLARFNVICVFFCYLFTFHCACWFLGTPTWPTTAGSSPTLAQEDCILVCTLLVSRTLPTSATESSVQPAICRRTSDSRTCHTAVSASRRRQLYLVRGTKVQCESSPPSPLCLCFRNLLTYLVSNCVTVALKLVC